MLFRLPPKHTGSQCSALPGHTKFRASSGLCVTVSYHQAILHPLDTLAWQEGFSEGQARSQAVSGVSLFRGQTGYILLKKGAVLSELHFRITPSVLESNHVVSECTPRCLRGVGCHGVAISGSLSELRGKN